MLLFPRIDRELKTFDLSVPIFNLLISEFDEVFKFLELLGKHLGVSIVSHLKLMHFNEGSHFFLMLFLVL